MLSEKNKLAKLSTKPTLKDLVASLYHRPSTIVPPPSSLHHRPSAIAPPPSLLHHRPSTIVPLYIYRFAEKIPGSDIDQYLENMSNDEWGDELTLLAASEGALTGGEALTVHLICSEEETRLPMGKGARDIYLVGLSLTGK
jgi:hypothetical protein